MLGPYKAQIDELLAENERLPRKQRYTSHKIYEVLRKRATSGSESNVRRYIAQRRREKRRPKVYLPLEFDPGADAQVDWGEAVAIIGGERVTVQVFYMRLNYSRKLFMRAFPAQKQEAFFEGHVHAFQHFQGVPRRISYDNLKAAVQQVLAGPNRQEQQTFIVFRSHYLFESHFCTPGKGHEKGGVEHGVGFGRRNFLVPLPEVASFEELNALLCGGVPRRRPAPGGWPGSDHRPGLAAGEAALTAVGQSETSSAVSSGRWCSTPTARWSSRPTATPCRPTGRSRNLVLKAYPFRVDVLHLKEVIASHPRCYERNQDILDPLHYLPLLEQRPGAFQHAKPIRRWRETWPAVFRAAPEPSDRSSGLTVRACASSSPSCKLCRELPGAAGRAGSSSSAGLRLRPCRWRRACACTSC